MITRAQGDHVVVAGMELGHVEGQVRGFRAAVDQVHHPVLFHREPGHEFFAEMGGHGLDVHGGGVLEQVDLLLGLGRNQGMIVSHADAEVLGHHVYVLFALGVPQVVPQSADRGKGFLVRAEQVDGRGEKGFALLHVGVIGPVGFYGRVLIDILVHDGLLTNLFTEQRWVSLHFFELHNDPVYFLPGTLSMVFCVRGGLEEKREGGAY